MTSRPALELLVLAVTACGGSTTRSTVTTTARTSTGGHPTGTRDSSPRPAPTTGTDPTPPSAATPLLTAPPLDRAMVVLGEQLTELYEALATAVTTAQTSCTTATVAITDLTRDRAPVIASYTAALHAGRGAELAAGITAASPTRYADAALRFLAAPAVSACAHDAGFTTALRSLQIAPVVPSSPLQPARSPP